MKEIVIEPGGGGSRYWADCWRYRELLLTLALRDIRVRYKQTIAGVLWVVLQPLATVLIFSFVFGHLAGLRPQSGQSYPLFVLAGLLPWQFFSNIVQQSSQSIVSNAGLVGKIYFPRLLAPLAAGGVCLVDFAVLLALTAAVFSVGSQELWSARMGFLPVLVLLAWMVALGPGLLLAALNVRYRDVRFVVPVLLQLGTYLSPVAFGSELVRERFGEAASRLYALNPMVGVIDGFRWVFFGGAQPGVFPLVVSAVFGAGFLWLGLAYFRRTERAFADII